MPSAVTTATRRLAVASSPPSPELLGAATVALFAAIESLPAGAPAATAYRSAPRHKGEDLAEAGGPAAIADVLARVRAEALAPSVTREAVLEAVWAGLARWRS